MSKSQLTEPRTAIDHQPWCDRTGHTDPAMDCATPSTVTAGLVTHVAATADGPRAYAETINPWPSALTAADCDALAARFAELSRTLAGAR